MAGSYRRKGMLKARGELSPFTRDIYMPLHKFLQTELLGSVLLLLAAVAAIIWANSPAAESYFELWHHHISIDLWLVHIDMDLHHWINDGLMALFFFVVGLEIKRELVHGNLNSPKAAALPAVAALGGMVAPALIYFALNPSGEPSAGWGIPMATDIAFAVGVLGLLGKRIPTELRVFLLALAIVDDIGAILVIALFYTESLSVAALGAGAVVLAVVFIMQRFGVRNPFAYFVVGAGFWFAIHESGIHATIAGVILGLLTPTHPYTDPEELPGAALALGEQYRKALAEGDESTRDAILGQWEELIQWSESPVEKMERVFHPWTAYVVLPLFALSNAGVALSGDALAAALASSVTLGIVLGLIGGKLVGIFLASLVAVKSGLAALPPGVNWAQVAGTALLAGIGFTVSLFITGLAFKDPAIIDQAKIGILGASLLAGIVGFGTLAVVSPKAGEGEVLQ